MHNLGTVISFEFIRTIKKRSFWLSVLFFPALMLIIFGLTYFSGKSADEASDKINQEKFNAVVLDDSKLVSPVALQALKIQPVLTKNEGIERVKDNLTDAFIYYPADPAKQSIEVYAKDLGLVKNGKYTAGAQQLLKSSVESTIGSPEMISIIKGDNQTKLTLYKDGQKTSGFERVIAPGALLALFYLVIVLLGNQMLTSTTEEKENRVIEMILTTVEAKTLIIGKIISLIMLGILQIAIITAPVLIAVLFFGDKLNLPVIDFSLIQIDPVQMSISAIIFVCAFLMFTGILVAVGAAVPTAKEASNFFGAVMGGMFVPLYTVMSIVTEPDQMMVKIFSFFPITAPVTLLLRNAVGNLGRGEAIIGVVILVVSSIVALTVATRVFRYGTLEYERKLSLKELFGR